MYHSTIIIGQVHLCSEVLIVSGSNPMLDHFYVHFQIYCTLLFEFTILEENGIEFNLLITKEYRQLMLLRCESIIW